MKKIVILGTTLALTISLFSCSKSDKSTPTNVDKSAYLTTGNWRMSAFTQTATQNGQTTTENVLQSSGTCYSDNFTKFNMDGSYVTDEGVTKCDSNDPQQVAGNWVLLDNSSKMVFEHDTLTVVALTATQLHTTLQFNDGGIAYFQDVTYANF